MFFNYYAPGGDIMTIVLCVIGWLFLFCTYAKREKSLTIFTGGSATCCLVAIESLIYNYMLQFAEKNIMTSYTLYTLETSIYCSLTAIFMWYIVYILDTFQVPQKHRKVIWWLSIPIFVFYTIMRLIKPFVEGYVINEAVWIFDRGEQWGFLSCYIYYIVLISILLIKYKSCIAPSVLFCLKSSMYIALGLTIIQSLIPATTFLSTSFMIPMLVALLLFHYNPYDTATGSMERMVFPYYLKDNKKKDLGMYTLRLKDFSLQDSNDITRLFIQHAADIFKNYQTFRMDDNTIILIFNKSSNLNTDTLNNILHRRAKYLYDIYHIPYKLIYSDIDLELLQPTDYILLNQYLFGKNDWNTIYECTYEDMARIIRTQKIKDLLQEIDSSDELTHPAIQIYCQPIFDTHSQTYKSIEILSRLQLDDELVMPSEFLPIAEYYGYNYSYNKKVFNQACEKFSELLHSDITVKNLSMNFSIKEFTGPTFIQDVLSIIKMHDIPCERVAIEITESIGANATPEILRKIIWKLKARGIKVYLDDFGVDYSNLDRVLHLPIDVIKFDSCITWALRNNPTLKPIITSMAESFHKAGYKVLFEGVETEEDELRCQYLNASYLQGFKYSKPIELDSLKNFLAQ